MAGKTGKIGAVHQLAVPPGTDNNELGLVSQFGGYFSSIDPTNANPNLLVRGSQNVYKKTSGTIANRFGKKLYDAAVDTTVAGIKSGFVWNNSLGTTLPLRVANSKVQVESNVTGTRVWYDLLTSLTTTRWVFDTWWDNTDKKDKVLFVGGNSNTYAWDGGIALFVSYAANVITLDRSAATAGFASSGTVTINGIDYTYTGISGSTLTGTSDASAASANQVVISKVVTNANTPASGFTNDFIHVVNNQLYSGSYTSQLIYISKNTSYTDHTHSTPRVAGEGDIVILDSTANGIGSIQGNAHIFYGKSNLSIITFSQVTVGTTLVEYTQQQKVDLGNNISALRHEFISTLSNNLIYLDKAQQLRSFGTFRNLFSAKAVLLSQPVQDELNQEDFTGGSLSVVSDRRGDIVYICAPNSGKTYWHQERSALDPAGNVVSERQWHPPMIWSVSKVDSISGSTVGFSTANPQIYYLWDTGQYYDDSPSTSQIPYQSIALWAYQNGGRRQGKMVFDKIYYEGYITQNTQLYGGVYFDYEGATGLLSPVINDPTSSPLISNQMTFVGVTPPSLGDASLGDNPLGDGLNTLPDDQSMVPKFRVIVGTTQTDCYEYALMVYSTNAGARWEILALGTNARMSISEGVEIMKQ